MPVVESVHIEAFRGLRDLTLAHLGDINLLVGANNSGKTSALEALMLPSQVWNARDLWALACQRSYAAPPSLTDVRWLFPDGRAGAIATEVGLAAGARSVQASMSEVLYEVLPLGDEPPVPSPAVRLALEIHVVASIGDEAGSGPATTYRVGTGGQVGEPTRPPTGFGPSGYMTWPADVRDDQVTRRLWAGLQKADREAIAMLSQRFEPGIADISLGMGDGRMELLVEHQRHGLSPIATYGDGVRRAVQLAAAVVRCRGGMLLIDEMESSLHTAALSGVFRWLVAACRQHNVQLVATTHSLEAIDAIAEAMSDNLDELVAYRLERLGDRVAAERHPGPMLRRLVHTRGLDIR